ncbi:MAG: RNase A-like domain-containing protein [Dehalococcoidia bacterium]
MPKWLKTWLPIATVLVVLGVGWFFANQPEAEEAQPDLSQAAADQSRTATPPQPSAARSPGTATPLPGTSAVPVAERYDLEADEARGGHTIQRHVARSEEDLRARLAREPDISAASSYYDLATAEIVVAAALEKKKGEIDRWSRASGSRANLALRYEHPESVGITLERGARSARDLDSVVVVLRWAGSDWYVLTSYPDD